MVLRFIKYLFLVLFLCLQSNLAFSTVGIPVSTHWIPAGWGGGGNFNNVVYDKYVPNRVYAMTDVGGGWVSTNNGGNWTSFNGASISPSTHLTFNMVTYLTQSDSNPNELVVNSGGGAPNGVAESLDSGSTWTVIDGNAYKQNVGSVGQPTLSDTLLHFPIASGGTITDGTETWTIHTTGVLTSSISGYTPGTINLYTGAINLTWTGHNSTNQPVANYTQTAISSTRSTNHASLAIDHNNASIIYDGDDSGNVWVTRNNGSSWSILTHAGTMHTANVGTAGGSSVSVTLTTTVNAGSVSITDTTETWKDDGFGHLLSNVPGYTTGTINYSTGAVSLFWTGHVATAQPVVTYETNSTILSMAVSADNTTVFIGTGSRLRVYNVTNNTFNDVTFSSNSSVYIDRISDIKPFAYNGTNYMAVSCGLQVCYSGNDGVTWAASAAISPLFITTNDGDIWHFDAQPCTVGVTNYCTDSGTVRFWVFVANPADLTHNIQLYVSDNMGASWGPNLGCTTNGCPVVPGSHVDRINDPTRAWESGTASGTNYLVMNPFNPQEAMGGDAWGIFQGTGQLTNSTAISWFERIIGAQNQVLNDTEIDPRGCVWASGMDVGSFSTCDYGVNWTSMSPNGSSTNLNNAYGYFPGEHWKVGFFGTALQWLEGLGTVVETVNPWYDATNGQEFDTYVVRSTQSGLPGTYNILRSIFPQTQIGGGMWGVGYFRSLAWNPNMPRIWAGFDGANVNSYKTIASTNYETYEWGTTAQYLELANIDNDFYTAITLYLNNGTTLIGTDNGHGGWSDIYTFTVSGLTTTPTYGTNYNNNGFTFGVLSTSISGGSGTITATGTGVPLASGILVKSNAFTGDTNINFSSNSTNYSVSGSINYSTGTIGVNVTPALSAAPYIEYWVHQNIVYSADQGATWQFPPAQPGFSQDFYNALTMDPVDPTGCTVAFASYSGGNGGSSPWITTNCGQSWLFMSNYSAPPIFLYQVSGVVNPPTGGSTYMNNGHTFTIDFTNLTAGSGLVVATGSLYPVGSGVLTQVSGSGDININFSSYSTASTTDLQIVPQMKFSSNGYLYAGTGSGDLWYTTTPAVYGSFQFLHRFTNTTEGNPNLDALTLDPQHSNRMALSLAYPSTDGRVVMTNDLQDGSNAVWYDISGDLPCRQGSNALAFNYLEGTKGFLYAVTYGCGVFKLDLNDISTPMTSVTLGGNNA